MRYGTQDKKMVNLLQSDQYISCEMTQTNFNNIIFNRAHTFLCTNFLNVNQNVHCTWYIICGHWTNPICGKMHSCIRRVCKCACCMQRPFIYIDCSGCGQRVYHDTENKHLYLCSCRQSFPLHMHIAQSMHQRRLHCFSLLIFLYNYCCCWWYKRAMHWLLCESHRASNEKLVLLNAILYNFTASYFRLCL